ncbi:MAG TPA: magnesium transporter CorA family protein [Patescibacteria group bacterium]|nr:magnesium transporter CorA family protein [Patescibacteria group bacterium]
MSKYQKISNKIEKISFDNPNNEIEKVSWYNIRDASKKELEYLRKKFNFKLEHLQASTAKVTSQRPITEVNKNYLFVILQFPTYEDNKVKQVIASEIDFFVGHGYIITLHNKNIKALDDFFNFCKKDNSSTLSYQLESSAIVLYEILKKLMSENYKLLDNNSLEINKVDQKIFSELPQKLNSEILSLKRNILNLRKIIQSHKNILKRLMAMKSSVVPRKELKKYYTELVDNSKRIWEITDNQKEHIDALYTTNESMMNFRITNIMKILTIFSIVVLPLNLLASIFGMNITNSMPFIGVESGFWLVITLMTIGSLAIFIYFFKKRWI